MIRTITVTLAALLLSGTALALSACATIEDGATEDLHIKITGTGEALCDVMQPGRRYRAYAPSSIRVMRSPDDLKVVCYAPGNRKQVVVLKATHSDKLAYNAANGFLPGATWDYMTGAAYAYPDTVVMDFTGMKPQPYPEPDYQKVLDENPEMVQMEQFRPGSAALGSDIGKPTPVMQKRDPNSEEASDILMPAPQSAPGVTGAAGGGSSPTSTTAAPAQSSLPDQSSSVKSYHPQTQGDSGAKTFVNGNISTQTAPGVQKNTTSGTSSGSGTSSSSTQHLFTTKIGTVPPVPQSGL